MKRRAQCALLCALVAAELTAAAPVELTYGRFGAFALHGNTASPEHVVLFISGEHGRSADMVDIAHTLADDRTLVVDTNLTRYLSALDGAHEKCGYPAADFEALSHFVQKALNLPTCLSPLLVGYSAGGALAYATLVQAPPGTFAGAVSVDMCPAFSAKKPLCRGTDLQFVPDGRSYRFLPANQAESRWIAIQGDCNLDCEPSQPRKFVSQSPGAKLIRLAGACNSISGAREYVKALRGAVDQLAAAKPRALPPAAAVSDLPLVELPGKGDGKTLAVIVSGDGGWAGIDREIGEALVLQGLAVVGLNSLMYFWTRRDPDSAARDFERILRHYTSAWRRDHIVLVGYSFGADVLPFMASRLPGDLRQRVKRIALLGLGDRAVFEFHVSQWLNKELKDALPVETEIHKLEVSVLCIYGDEEKESLCPKLRGANVIVRMQRGGHHFGGNYRAIAEEIVNGIR